MGERGPGLEASGGPLSIKPLANGPLLVEGNLEIRDELLRALWCLPVKQRAAVVFRYYEDLSERQVAQALGCSVPAARSQLSRGMKTLRNMIGSEAR